MSTCHRLSKGWTRGAAGGLATPRGWPSPDQATSPPPSRGGLWVGPRLLLGGCFAWLSQVDGRLPSSFAQISVGKGLSVNYSMYLCLCPAKQYCPNTCATWLIVNAYVFKIANFSSFIP
jgi:hypothetical protein